MAGGSAKEKDMAEGVGGQWVEILGGGKESRRMTHRHPLFVPPPVLLRGCRGGPRECGAADLPEAVECHGPPELHVHLPELSRLAGRSCR